MVRNAAAASDGKTHPDELKSEVGDGQERFPGSRKYGGPERASFSGSSVISLCLHSPFLHTDTIFGLHLVVPPSSRKPGNALRSQSDFNRSNPHTQQEKNSLSASLPRNPQIHRLPLARTGSRVHVWANNCTGSLTSPNWLRPIRAHLRRYRQNSSHPNCTRRIEGGGVQSPQERSRSLHERSGRGTLERSPTHVHYNQHDVSEAVTTSCLMCGDWPGELLDSRVASTVSHSIYFSPYGELSPLLDFFRVEKNLPGTKHLRKQAPILDGFFRSALLKSWI